MLMQLNWLDYVFIGFISFSTLMGFVRGLVQELSSLVNWAFGIWSGIVFYESMAAQLPEIIQPAEIRHVIGFFIVFGIVLITVTVLSKSLSWLVKNIGLKGPDSILGVFFGGLRGILFIAIFILVTKSSSFAHSNAWRSSILIPYFEPLEYWLADLIPYDFK
jgi:membrane protein required for colicin V production